MSKDSNKNLSLKNRILFIGIVALLVWMHLIWDHLHEGVPTHHILARGDLPGISNWWGGLAVPLLTWFLLSRITKRVNNNSRADANKLSNTIYGFLGALFFGITLSFLFTIGSDIPGYMMLGAILISFLIPLYKAEILLGYIIGMTYTFGGILPIVIGGLLMLIFTIAHKFVRGGILFLASKIGLKKAK